MNSTAAIVWSSGDQSAAIHSPETGLSRRAVDGDAGSVTQRSMSFPLRALLDQASHLPVRDHRGETFRERPSVSRVASPVERSNRVSWKFSAPPSSVEWRI